MRTGTLLGGALALVFVLAAPAAYAGPKVGEPAPEFLFEGGGRTFASADYFGEGTVGEGARKKGVVVAWFPKAFTPG